MIGAEAGNRLRAAQRRDGQGNLTPQRNWDAATSTPVAGPVSVQPMGTAEARDTSGVAATDEWRLFDRTNLTPGFWAAGDRFEWTAYGLALEVVGDPQWWPAPNGGIHHWEVALRKQAPTTQDVTGAAAALRAGMYGVVDEAHPWTP